MIAKVTFDQKEYEIYQRRRLLKEDEHYIYVL